MVVLYCLASVMLGYTLYTVFRSYMVPITVADASTSARLAQAAAYQFSASLLWVSSLLLPGIYAAWKSKKFRIIFPALEILHLAFWRLIIFK